MGRSSRAISQNRALQAWALRSKGWSETQIAAELGISQPAVSMLLAKAEQQVLDKLEDIVTRVKIEQHYELQHVISEALMAWEGSKKPITKTKLKENVTPQQAKQGQPGTLIERESEVLQRDPAAAFLQTALNALAAQRDLWGITGGGGDGNAPGAAPRGSNGSLTLPPLRQVVINIPQEAVSHDTDD